MNSPPRPKTAAVTVSRDGVVVGRINRLNGNVNLQSSPCYSNASGTRRV